MKPAPHPSPDAWTDRERQVLDLIAARKTNGEIAETLGLSFYTAKWHVSEILSKLGVETREEAARYWRGERGWRGRMKRVARVFAPATALKMAIGTGVLSAAIVGATLALHAARPEAAAADVAQTTATSDADRLTADCATFAQQCAFAKALDTALEADNGKTVLAMSQNVSVSCPDIGTASMRGPLAFCLGSEVQDANEGYITGDELSQRVAPAAALTKPRPEDSPQAEDDFGGGALRLASIGCPVAGVSYSCDQQFGVVFTWIAPTLGRTVRIYLVDRSPDGGYLIRSHADYRVVNILGPAINGGTGESPFGPTLALAFRPLPE